MVVYADSSFLVSLYVPETNSTAALQVMRHGIGELPFTPLHRLEIRNAVRLRVFRKEISRAQRSAILDEMEADLDGGSLVHIPLPWIDVLREAERLSAARTETIGSRCLDILHVATALVLGAREFLTFDANQRKLAMAEGLKVKPS